MVKFVDKLMSFVETVLIVLMSGATLIVVAQVFWRYVLHSPLGWTEQVCRIAFIWMVMLGIPVIFNRGITMAFDILIDHIHGKAHFIIQVAILILGLAFSVFYFMASMQLCLSAVGRMTSGVKVPQNLLYGAQHIAAALLFLVLLKQLIELVRTEKGSPAEETAKIEGLEEGE